VMILRFTDRNRPRPFRTPLLWVVAPASIVGCLVLFMSLDGKSKGLFVAWSLLGLVFYFAYGFRRSEVARGVAQVPELNPDVPPTSLAPMPGAPAPGAE
jgi:basic amino acid/polyamine antiporter, APA family